MRRRMRLHRLGIWRLETEAAGAIDRADQHLQHVQRPRGLETVGMSRDAAHGVHGNRAALHGFVTAAGPVGPGNGQLDFLLEGLEKLDERSRDIINRRWLAEPKATLQDLADEYKVSAERIRQIEAAAFKKMRALFED